jgi:hypothetical protein
MKLADDRQLEKIVGHLKEHLDRDEQAVRAAWGPGNGTGHRSRYANG